MINFGALIFLIIAHYLCGRGLLQLFKLELKAVQSVCLSLMVGVPILSFAPCIVQLLKIPITKETIMASIEIMTAVFSIPLVLNIAKNYNNIKLPKLALPQIYELPFFGVIILLLTVSVWRCFYYPPTAADMLDGPELLAKYAIRDKNMISSVFNIDLQVVRYGASNIFKSPFITSLQIIYKLMVQPFGQLWLSVLVLSFITWLYSILKERMHPLIAGTLMVIFIIIPELYAYTFLMLYDYSTMVFFFIGFYYLTRYMESDRINELVWASLMMGLATYIRTETLVFVFLIAPLLAFHLFKKKVPIVKSLIHLGIFTMVTVIFYFICMKLFVANFVPIKFELKNQLNTHLGDISLFFDRLTEISTKLIFSIQGEAYYGLFFDIFLFILIVDVVTQRFIFKKKEGSKWEYNLDALTSLYGIVVVYIGMAFIGHVFPNFTIENTTKRGMFKVLVLGLWYMSNSTILLRLSGIITRWENKTDNTQDVLAEHNSKKKEIANPAPVTNAPRSNKKK